MLLLLKVMPEGVQVADSQGAASISQVLCGIEWVLANKAAAVINLSLDGAASSADMLPCNGTDSTSALHQAICGATNQGKVSHLAQASQSSHVCRTTVSLDSKE